MLHVELTECGIEEVLESIQRDLKSAIGLSKRRQTEKIYESLGQIRALLHMIYVSREVPEEDSN